MDMVSTMSPMLDSHPSGDPIELIDDFADGCAEGRVIGRVCKSGHVRLGADVESVFSIDNGALRVAPLVQAGFGRAVLSYGPFAARPGHAFAVFMLNGHNTAQDEPLSDSFRHRLRGWLHGSETDPAWKRVAIWLRHARFRRALRQVRWWYRTANAGQSMARLNENLAIGWFSSAVEPDPRERGSGFVMHALGPENGELWAGQADSRTRSLHGVQNLPLYYVCVARPDGCIYYVSGVEGASGPGAYPSMRPIAVNTRALPDQVYLGIQQSVLGQVGFRLDTRVYGVRVGMLAGFDTWCGGAHAAAECVAGAGSQAVADVGGQWTLWSEAARVGPVASDRNAAARGGVEMAVLDPAAPSGFIHATAAIPKGRGERLGIVFRGADARNHWRLQLVDGAGELIVVTDGEAEVLVTRQLPEVGNDGSRRLQILDDGARLMAYVDGEPLTDGWIADPRLSDATGVGVLCSGSGLRERALRRFEAHPRSVPIPGAFDMGAPWLRKGTQSAVSDDFSGAAGELDGRHTTVGDRRWSRVIGTGRIGLDGAGVARVRATAKQPCPGRTAYCVDWDTPEFADVEATVTPSGTRVGEKEKTMSGLILYQDPDNFMILNAYRTDYYPGGSVSTFFRFGGYEDVYDAIWSNVGARVTCGKPLRLRLCCDGERFLVFIDDEPVLYRAFRDVYSDVGPLRVRKVGIVANWEFGTDTGSAFERFRTHV